MKSLPFIYLRPEKVSLSVRALSPCYRAGFASGQDQDESFYKIVLSWQCTGQCHLARNSRSLRWCYTRPAWSLGVLGSVNPGLYRELWRHREIHAENGVLSPALSQTSRGQRGKRERLGTRLAPSYPYITYLLLRFVFQLYLGTCARALFIFLIDVCI